MDYRVEYSDETEPSGLVKEPCDDLTSAKIAARRRSRLHAANGDTDMVYVVASYSGADVGHIAYTQGVEDHRDGRLA